MSSDKSTFGSKLGVVAATVGSAIGLGNVWRFPAEAQNNGGAAFLIVYIACVFILGIPVMLAELSLGRAGRSDSVGNFKNLTPKNHWWLAGAIGLVASYLILSFYMVVAGWTVEYLFDSLSGDLFSCFAPMDQAQENNYFAAKMGQYVASAWAPLIWTFLVVFINLAVLLMGVRNGIEKMSNVLMPMLFVLMLIFCVVSLSLPNASEGLAFFLKPDFSKITPAVLINALGQAFFSLSLGMGILVTYSAYYPSNTNLVHTAVSVSLLDFMMAFIMGLIIFPAVMSFHIGDGASSLEGTTLIFVTMPEIFTRMGCPALWSALFFLLLAVAAITSTISLAEVSVAFVRDRFKASRKAACLIVMLPLLLTSALCSLSLGAVPSLSFFGMPLFDFLDAFATNMLLPISALLICLYVGWVLPRGFIADELTNHGILRGRAAGLVAFIIRFLAPALILIVFIAQIIKL
ncbi:MAG: sodium-dependent transporter [Lachnospiraceae bacterium]|nr:sodium-dependent transporter [Lachnospiraceae bacterium]